MYGHRVGTVKRPRVVFDDGLVGEAGRGRRGSRPSLAWACGRAGTGRRRCGYRMLRRRSWAPCGAHDRADALSRSACRQSLRRVHVTPESPAPSPGRPRFRSRCAVDRPEHSAGCRDLVWWLPAVSRRGHRPQPALATHHPPGCGSRPSLHRTARARHQRTCRSRRPGPHHRSPRPTRRRTAHPRPLVPDTV
jgi:hypothetical protein